MSHNSVTYTMPTDTACVLQIFYANVEIGQTLEGGVMLF